MPDTWWLVFEVDRTQIRPSLDPKIQLLLIRMVSKHCAWTLLGLEKEVEPVSTALRRI